jgi:hypothetical protein
LRNLFIFLEFLPRCYEDEVRLYGIHRRETFFPDSVARQCAAACIEGASDLPPFFFGSAFLAARVYNDLGAEMCAQFGIAKPGVIARVKVNVFCGLTAVKQLYDRWIGIDADAGVTFVRGALRRGLEGSGGAVCTYRFRIVDK